jgi:hypothetical protein
MRFDQGEFYRRKTLKKKALSKLNVLDVSTSLPEDKRELMLARVRGIIEDLEKLERRMKN